MGKQSHMRNTGGERGNHMTVSCLHYSTYQNIDRFFTGYKFFCKFYDRLRLGQVQYEQLNSLYIFLEWKVETKGRGGGEGEILRGNIEGEILRGNIEGEILRGGRRRRGRERERKMKGIKKKEEMTIRITKDLISEILPRFH